MLQKMPGVCVVGGTWVNTGHRLRQKLPGSLRNLPMVELLFPWRSDMETEPQRSQVTLQDCKATSGSSVL